MKVDDYKIPALSFGYLPEYVAPSPSDNTKALRKFRLRPGQFFAMNPHRVNVRDSVYFDAGLTHLIQNDGQTTPTSHDKLGGMPSSKRIESFAGGQPVNQWSDPKCREFADLLCASLNGGYGFFCHQMQELIDSIPQYQLKHEYGQEAIIHARIQSNIDAFGGRCYGGYDGHLNLNQYFNGNKALSELRAGLNDPAQSLVVAKGNTGFGDQFYTGNQHLVRHGTIKIYAVGDYDIEKWMCDVMSRLQIDKQSRQALGSNRRVAVIGFADYNEMPSRADGFLVNYDRAVAGGICRATHFSKAAFTAQLALIFEALALDFDFYNFDTEHRHGTDPSVIHTNDQYIGSGNPTRKPTRYAYSTEPTAYPSIPIGGSDVCLIAAEMMSEAGAYAGFNSVRASHRNTGQNNWTAVDGDYLIDMYESNMGTVRLGQTGARRWVKYQNMNIPAGVEEEVEININNGSQNLVIQALGHEPYLRFIDTAA